MMWAGNYGFRLSAGWSVIDIWAISRITDRKAQLARFAYFTIPLTTMAMGWMGGVELAKLTVGRKEEQAWMMGAIVPGGIMGIWTRNLWGGVRTAGFLGVMGAAYQWATNNNYTNSILPNMDNPNRPHPLQWISRQQTLWSIDKGSPGDGAREIPLIFPKKFIVTDPGPSWKKWEDEE